MSIHALVFDLDGTLAHTDPLHYRAWREALAHHGVEVDEAEYARRISGRHNPEIIADLLPHLGEREGLAFAEAKEARFREIALELTPLPGLRELLARARGAGLALGLVTNAPRANATFMVRALGLEEAFDEVGLGEDAAAAKPDPAPYRDMLARLEVGPDEALAFEDSPSGIRSARGAGVRVVGVATTQDAETLEALGASPVIEDFEDAALWRDPLAFLERAESDHPGGSNRAGD